MAAYSRKWAVSRYSRDRVEISGMAVRAPNRDTFLLRRQGSLNQSIRPVSQCTILTASFRLSQPGTFMPIGVGGSP